MREVLDVVTCWYTEVLIIRKGDLVRMKRLIEMNPVKIFMLVMPAGIMLNESYPIYSRIGMSQFLMNMGEAWLWVLGIVTLVLIYKKRRYSYLKKLHEDNENGSRKEELWKLSPDEMSRCERGSYSLKEDWERHSAFNKFQTVLWITVICLIKVKSDSGFS